MVAQCFRDDDLKTCNQYVDKAEAKSDVLEVRKYPFTVAKNIMVSTESLLHKA
jgi:hypothetical protein